MAEQRAQRRLAAILAADVVGYSRLMQQDEPGTLATLKSRRSEILQPVVSRHRGRIVKLMGDGVLVEFASAVDAVECSVRLQEAMDTANAGLPEHGRIVLRVGINLGDVIVEGSDIFGDGVNVAARLEALAEPGGVYISGSIYDQVKGRSKLAFEDVGRQALKNMAEPVQIYRVRTGSVAEREDHRRKLDILPLPAKPSIAVLPLTNMSGEPEQQYFSDGITEGIITELSRFSSLFVIARNSSFAYRGAAIDVRQVSRELGVRFILEGSVQKSANRLRITAQLIDGTNGSHIWSERYDRGMGDLFEVQDEVARTIVATLVGRLENAEIRSAARKRTDNLPAYDCLLRGIEHLRGYADDDNRRARELFERAISLDPRYALAHAYFALALVCEHGYGDAPDPIKDRALQSALTGLRLDPDEGRCHQFLGEVHLFRGDFDSALSHIERSIALNPNDANAVALLGHALAFGGRAEEGVGLIRQAMRLNPFHPDWYWSDLAIASYAARRYEESLEADRRITGRNNYWSFARLAACYAQLGKLEEARAQAAEVLRLKPDFHFSEVKLVYKNPADAEHLFEGMRKAGLPE
jgi:adenylate cyclase